jgi:hypothetical protein
MYLDKNVFGQKYIRTKVHSDKSAFGQKRNGHITEWALQNRAVCNEVQPFVPSDIPLAAERRSSGHNNSFLLC